jgi:transcriptional regulator with XRE-family HTH domain
MTEPKRIGRTAPGAGATDEADRQGLGARLRESREYLRLSQDEVARALDLSRSAVSLMETGQRKVDAIELKRLAEIYQRPIAYFTSEVGDPSAVPEAVQHLARAATALTDRDREELLRFAEFLQARAR